MREFEVIEKILWYCVFVIFDYNFFIKYDFKWIIGVVVIIFKIYLIYFFYIIVFFVWFLFGMGKFYFVRDKYWYFILVFIFILKDINNKRNNNKSNSIRNSNGNVNDVIIRMMILIFIMYIIKIKEGEKEIILKLFCYNDVCVCC